MHCKITLPFTYCAYHLHMLYVCTDRDIKLYINAGMMSIDCLQVVFTTIFAGNGAHVAVKIGFVSLDDSPLQPPLTRSREMRLMPPV